MLQNAKGTAFTVSNLLRENHWGGEGGGGGENYPSSPTQIKVKFNEKVLRLFLFSKITY